jgi:hypothetical protein
MKNIQTVAKALDWLCYTFGFVDDPWGHRWTFSQSVANGAPETWGARPPG